MDTHLGINDFNPALSFQTDCGVIEVSQSRKPSIPRFLSAFAGRKKKIARLVVVNVFAMNSVWDKMKVLGICDNSTGWCSPNAEHGLGSRQLCCVDKCGKDGND